MANQFADESLSAALDRSLSNAKWLRAKDAAAVAAAKALARKIDVWDEVVEWAFEDAEAHEGRSRPKVPEHDNISLGSFLKYLEALGLTPEKSAAPKKSQAAEKRKSALDAFVAKNKQ